MTISTKKIVAAVLMAAGLILIFGVVAPALISGPTIAVVLGFALLILMAIGGVILVRNALGMKPIEPVRDDDEDLDFFE